MGHSWSKQTRCGIRWCTCRLLTELYLYFWQDIDWRNLPSLVHHSKRELILPFAKHQHESARLKAFCRLKRNGYRPQTLRSPLQRGTEKAPSQRARVSTIRAWACPVNPNFGSKSLTLLQFQLPNLIKWFLHVSPTYKRFWLYLLLACSFDLTTPLSTLLSS